MPTLNDLRKAAGYKTIRAFAEAMHCSASKASMILQGRYISTFSSEEYRNLASVLKIEETICWDAMSESYQQWHNSWYDPQKHGSRIEKPRSPLDIMIDRACGLE